jgi:outer membrane receptor for ferrienterochelin and colicins
LRDEIVATESIGARELEKTGATMLTEALDKRPGISVQTECSICNVRNVVLNNLPGRYTTLLIDGIPIFSSVSTAYGLDSVNLGGIERIDISRGAGSSLIAPEALAGSVNIVTRRPLKDEFMANQQFGSFGQWNTDLFGAKTFTGGALTANFTHNQHDTVDGDGNGVPNTPASNATWAASASSSTTSAASSSRAASTWSTKAHGRRHGHRLQRRQGQHERQPLRLEQGQERLAGP